VQGVKAPWFEEPELKTRGVNLHAQAPAADKTRSDKPAGKAAAA
jgi:hypothetical protein